MKPGPSPFVLLRANRSRLHPHLSSSLPPFRGFTSGPPPHPQPYPNLYDRLKPVLPFVFWWTTITSLAVHQLRVRHRSAEEIGVAQAKISVLDGLISRIQNGEDLSEDDIRKELEMVGLRERTRLTEKDEDALQLVKDVGWGQALFGRKFGKKTADEEEKEAVEEWAKVVEQANQTASHSSPSPSTTIVPSSTTSPSSGIVRRAPGANVYL